MIGTKLCSHCRQIRSINDFTKRASSPDGYGYHCFECRTYFREKGKEHRAIYLTQTKERTRLLSRMRKKAKKIIEPKRCKECDKTFVPEYSIKARWEFCSDSCMKKYHKRNGEALRRARKKGSNGESFNLYEVFIRDKWRCQLCGVKTPKRLRGTTKANAPELDHIIPLSKGGEHSKRNTQCACRKCNGEKGARELGQLRLFG
jgi:5-methylcytosine-specific restriction endonuclease McrA